jgi:zinc protease
MNLALGGLFSSRINLNLREEHGYTYGAGSGFLYRRFPGPFYAATGVQTAVTVPATIEILKEIRRIVDAPLSAEELKLAKDAFLQGLPGTFETSMMVVATYANFYTYDLGLDYLSRLPGLISGVTTESAQTAARKYLQPDKLVVILVGDLKKIEPQLVKLGLGQYELRDADGNVKKK